MIYENIPEPIHSIFMRQFFLKIYPVPSFNPFKPIKLETNDAEYFQTFETLPDALDSRIMHQAITAYYSDYNLLTAYLSPHGVSYAVGDMRSTSLDHTIYFYHDLKVDEWALYDMNAMVSSQSRGLNARFTPMILKGSIIFCRSNLTLAFAIHRCTDKKLLNFNRYTLAQYF